MILAPSGVAALNIRGRTIHSALSLPITSFSLLGTRRLANHQLWWKDIQFVIIDEKSMLGQHTLAMIDSCLRQALPLTADQPFGNINLALVGDFAQLPPVGDSPLYSPPTTADTDNGVLGRQGNVLYTVYRLFTKSFRLQIIHRQQGDSPEQIQFRDLLRHASKGKLSHEEWQQLITRSQQNLGPDERQLLDDAVCLYATRNDVSELNLWELHALNVPCARIQAKHDGGPEAAKAPADEAGGLESCITLGRGAKVMITRNIWQQQGLVNATTGILEDIIWAEGAERSDLPLAVLVSCKSYQGPTLWGTEPRPGFPAGIPIVPVSPIKTTFELDGKVLSRTQVPIRLAWAVTIHKSQGLTLDRIKLGLGKREVSTGLTFVGLSRVKSFNGIMLVDHVDYSRVKKLGGRHLQHRFDDFERRYPVIIN